MSYAKNFAVFCWASAALLTLILLWDFSVLEIETVTLGYIAVKAITIGSFIFLGFQTFNLEKLTWQQEAYGVLYYIYSFYGLAYIDMTYSVSFIQGFFALALFMRISTLRFISLNVFGFICMVAGFYISKEPTYVAVGHSLKPHLFLELSLLLMIGMLFYFLIQRFQNKINELNEKFAMIGKQSSFLVHEIKTPLNRVLINSESDISVEKMKDIHRDSQKIFALVNSVEILTRHPSKLVSTFSHFDWQELNDSLSYDFESYLKSMNINLQVIGFEGQFYGNKYLFYQLIKNMILNAVEAIGYRSDEMSEIIIKLEDRGEFKHLTIHNSNSMIDKKDIAHVFDFHFTTKKDGWNRGLGLPLVKNIIEAHLGSISVSSTDNCTRFEIKLPDFSKKRVNA